MLNDITIGQYYPGNSMIHRLDPRSKITFCILYIVSLFIINTGFDYACLSLILVSCIAVSRLPFRTMAKAVKPLWIIILLTVIFQAFAGGGTVLWKAGSLAITSGGLITGLQMSLRLVLLILVSSLLTLTTSPLDLTDAIERLLNPFRKIGVPAHEIAMMMTIALRFIPTLIEELDRIMKAQQSRGAEFGEGSILARARNIVPLLVPLFISAFRRADELAVAMEARCYRGGVGRTKMKVLMFVSRDWIAVIIGCMVLMLVVYLRYSSV